MLKDILQAQFEHTESVCGSYLRRYHQKVRACAGLTVSDRQQLLQGLHPHHHIGPTVLTPTGHAMLLICIWTQMLRFLLQNWWSSCQFVKVDADALFQRSGQGTYYVAAVDATTHPVAKPPAAVARAGASQGENEHTHRMHTHCDAGRVASSICSK